MSETDFSEGRRSTRLSISIPVVISGVDAEGNQFQENVRTLVVNKHGGKLSTSQKLLSGSEIVIENRALNLLAKTTVAWLSMPHPGDDVVEVGLELTEAQNIWGISFPPDDWTLEVSDPDSLPAAAPSAPEPWHPSTVLADSQFPSLAAEEINIRLLQELQESADAHAREFQERLKQLSHRIGLELEMEMRERAASAKIREVSSQDQQIKTFGESLNAVRKEVTKLEARMQALGNKPEPGEPPAAPQLMQEAQRQLTALVDSVVASMNREAHAGIEEFRRLLQTELQTTVDGLGKSTVDGRRLTVKGEV